MEGHACDADNPNNANGNASVGFFAVNFLATLATALEVSMSHKSSPYQLAARLAIAAVLLAAAALTGCTADERSASHETSPSLFSAAHVSPEPISTLGENYALPPDSRHHYRLRGAANAAPVNAMHGSL
jgi:hypothetical protein